MVADPELYKHFDVYAGAVLSTANNGLASNFLTRNRIDPAIGGRLPFWGRASSPGGLFGNMAPGVLRCERPGYPSGRVASLA